MKSWLIILLVILTLAIGGCSFTANTTQQQHALHSDLLASDVAVLSSTYDAVKALVNLKQEKEAIFNDADWDKLLEVDASINLLVLKYKVIVKVDKTDFDIQDVSLMWDMTKSSYKKAREVVVKHIGVFDVDAQKLFNDFDKKASEASETIDKLLENPSDADITQIVYLVVTVLDLALKIVSVTVV